MGKSESDGLAFIIAGRISNGRFLADKSIGDW